VPRGFAFLIFDTAESAKKAIGDFEEETKKNTSAVNVYSK
jgi:hypothetical protein